jgi:phosphoribosyl 1,2-cyclic phosphodiesterase
VTHTDGQDSPRLAMVNLGSGSSGNCTLLEAKSNGLRRRILIDCGFSLRRTRTHLDGLGTPLESIDAVVITHFDRDHFNPVWTSTLERLNIPVHFASEHHAAATRAGLTTTQCRPYDDAIDFGAGLSAHPKRMAHDSTGCWAYRFNFHDRSLGFATDLGHVPDSLLRHFAGVDVFAVESNYDRAMQVESDRPEFLKQRIMDGSGHLSNEQSLHAVRHLASTSNLAAIVLLHLSRQCNDPQLIHELYAACEPALASRLVITSQFEMTPWVECRPTAAQC